MGVVKDVVPAGGEAEVGTQHFVVGLLIDTADGQHRDRQCVGVVGVMVEPRVVLAHDGVAHGAVGLSLVGVILNLVLTGIGLVAEGCQGAEFHFANRLPLQLALELQIDGVQVYVVVVQLVLDVERRVVAGVVLVSVHGARRVQGKAERVDVEVALHLTGHRVDRLAQRARLALLAVAAAADEVQRHLLGQLHGGVHVGGVTLYLVLTVAPRVVHSTERTVEADVLRTTRHADGVVVLDAAGEQLAEPVGIAVFRLTEVRILSRFVVGQGKGACGVVIDVRQLIHLAEDAAVGGAVGVGEVEPALVAHFLIDVHLLLRVHDVVLTVARTQAKGVFAGIAYAGLAGLALLGGDNNDTRHGSGTVDRGG